MPLIDTMNNTERRVLEGIDHEGMMEFIETVVSTPSFGGDETAAQRVVASILESLGFSVDAWMMDFDELRRHPEFSMTIPREKGMGVAATWGEGERSLMICGHIDTVAPGDREAWDTPPLEATVVEGRLQGRGTVDMKAGLACGLYAVKAVMDAGVKPKGRVIFTSVIGEEDGGCGALATCLRGYRADAGIIMEPSETKIAPEVAGAMSFHVTVPGRSAHACVREEGVSAIDKFIALVESLRELEGLLQNKRVLLTHTPSLWPTRGWLTSGFGYRISPFTGLRQRHEGIDISNRIGTPIIAPADGVVTNIGREWGFGKILVISHGFGFITRFAHLDRIDVKIGQKVKRGEEVAKMGSTGRSTGPHLHYEVRVNGVPVNPLKYILN